MGNDGLWALLCGVVLCASVSALAETDAEDEELPDLEFLEFLGLWEETDYEWLLLDEEEVGEAQGEEDGTEAVEEAEGDAECTHPDDDDVNVETQPWPRLHPGKEEICEVKIRLDKVFEKTSRHQDPPRLKRENKPEGHAERGEPGDVDWAMKT